MDGDFFCCLCGNGKSVSFQSKEELQEHFRSHGKKRKLEDKSVSTNTNNKVIKCDVCPASFNAVNDAINHKFKAHPESSNFHFCPFCGKRFPLKNSKEIHIKFEHAKEKAGSKKLVCECGEQFYTDHGIKYHIESFHKRSNLIVMPETETMPASKKIKKNVCGELVSVYYCHFCGAEYLVKFNLQRHIETTHSEEVKKEKPEQLFKCSLCCSVFYNKKAYDNHNLLHKPDDLYITTEKHRALTVSRIDCDLDITRIPSLWDKLQPTKRPRVKRISNRGLGQDNSLSFNKLSTQTSADPDNRAVDSGKSAQLLQSALSSSTNSLKDDQIPTNSSDSHPSNKPSSNSTEEKMKIIKNRALVDSDNENNNSDSSDEETSEMNEKVVKNSVQTDSDKTIKADCQDKVSQSKSSPVVNSKEKMENSDEVEVLINREKIEAPSEDSAKQKLEQLNKQSARINKRIQEPGRETVNLTELKHAKMSLSFINSKETLGRKISTSKTVILKEISAGKKKGVVKVPKTSSS